MTEDIWTVKRILEWIEGYLAKHGDENPRLAAQWLVADALDCSRMQLYLDMERPLTNEERDTLRDYTRRRALGEPLQYILGKTAFRYIDVIVRKGVLIPRPETEVLVSEALAMLPHAAKPQDALDAALIRQFEALSGEEGETGEPDAHGQASAHGEEASARDEEHPLLVADICTGSGCIACSIAYEHPRTRVMATDISPEACALAKENASALDLSERVEVVECDLADGIDSSLLGSFDLVVSNPPYVPTAVLEDIPREVSAFEPALALDGGEDGLDIFRRLLAWCTAALRPGGAFAFELHETCLDEAAEEARQAGFADVRVIEDLAGRPRVLAGRKG